MNFADRLDAAVHAVENPCLLGIDPHLDLLPDEFAVARDRSAPRPERAEALQRFCTDLIDVGAGRVSSVKPQSAFFEVLGADGVAAWEHVVSHAHERGLLVIGDVKRNDIASTAAAYATAFLTGSGPEGSGSSELCDAITVNPYLGTDSLDPFLAACRGSGKGLFVLVRTSNPKSADFQLVGSPPLAERIASEVEEWGADLRGECGFQSVGAVVGATKRAELTALRELMPHAIFLVPGYGSQGAGAEDVIDAFPDPGHPFRGALINASRSIGFAYRKPEHAGKSWVQAAGDALDSMIADIRNALTKR